MPVLLRSSVAVYVHVYNMMLTIYTQIRERRAQRIYTSESITPPYMFCGVWHKIYQSSTLLERKKRQKKNAGLYIQLKF